MKDTLIIYKDWWEAIKSLPSNLRFEAFDAICAYAFEGRMPEDQMISAVTALMRSAIDRDRAKYEDICNKRRMSGQKGGAPKGNKNACKQKQAKQANGFQNKQKQAKQPDNEHEYEHEYDNDGNTKLSLGDTNIEEKQKEKKREALEAEERKFINFLKYFNKCISESNSSIRPCKELDDERREALRQIFSKYSDENIMTAVRNIMYSNFANGRTAQRKKPADIDWLLKPRNFKHAFEGSL